MRLSALLPTRTAVPTISWLKNNAKSVCELVEIDSQINREELKRPAGSRGMNEPHTDRIFCRSPPTTEHVHISPTDTAMADFNVHVGLLPLFGLELFPHHLAVYRIRAFSQPSFELVVCCHDESGRDNQ